MNNFKDILNESMKVKLFEDQFGEEPEVPTPTAEEVPAEPEVVEGDVAEAPAEEVIQDEGSVVPTIDDKLIASLVEANPELKSLDVAELKKGMEVELEHLDTVGGDMNIIAKITANHLNEFPGKDYYGALVAMEDGLREPTEEVPAEGTPEEVVGDSAEAPVEDVVEEPQEAEVEESKVKGAKAEQPKGTAKSQMKNESKEKK